MTFFHCTQKHISSSFLPFLTFVAIHLFIHLCEATWAAYVIASSCRADRQPRSVVSSGMDTLYQTSGGLTLDRELVSTTGSGCRRPIFTAWTNWLVRGQISFCLIKKKKKKCRMPRHVRDNYRLTLNRFDKEKGTDAPYTIEHAYGTLTLHWHVLCVRFCMSQFLLFLLLGFIFLLHSRRFL